MSRLRAACAAAYASLRLEPAPRRTRGDAMVAAPPRREPAAPTEGPGSTLDGARRDYHTLRRLVLAALVTAAACPLALNVADPDLWGHVRYGQEWIATGELPRSATHTFTAEGHPWINHENLAELLLAGGLAAVGVPGLLVGKCLLGLAILGLMWLTARRQGVRPLAAWTLFLLVAYNLQAFFPLRPQILSFLWCAVMLWLVDRAFAHTGDRRNDFRHTRRHTDEGAIDWRWLAPTPLLLAVWANSHGGFVAGLAILGALLAGRAAQLVWRVGREALPAAAGLAGVFAASAAATLVNPYGADLHRWLQSSLGEPRPEITEWGPPLPGNPVFVPFVLLVLVTVATLCLSRRRRDPVQLAILALVGWQAATHLRHIAFFALLCGFWLPPHLQSIAGALRQRAAQGLPTASLSPWMRAVGVVGLSAVIALQAVSLGGRLATLPVYRSNYPVDAIRWMAEENARGKLLVCFNWAQYALAALAPDVRVAFDGRFRTCYPQAVVDRHFDFLLGDTWPRHRSDASGPIDGARALRDDAPDYVLLDRRYKHAAREMAAASEAADSPWLLVYQDAVAQVWGRREAVGNPDDPRYVDPERRFVSDHFSETAADWPALPRDNAPASEDRPVARRAEAPSEPQAG